MLKKLFTYKVAIHAILLVLVIIIMIINYMRIYPVHPIEKLTKFERTLNFHSRQLHAAPQYMNNPNCRTNITTNTIKYNRPTIRNTKNPPNDQIIEYSTLSTWNKKWKKSTELEKQHIKMTLK